MHNNKHTVLREGPIHLILRALKKYLLRLISNNYSKNLIMPIKDFVTEDYVITSQWEPEVINVIKNNSLTNDLFIDIGSNIGITTFQVSHLFKTCLLFEPSSVLANVSEFNLAEKKNCVVYNYGIAKVKGEAKLTIPKNNTGSATIDVNGSYHCKLINRYDFEKLISPYSDYKGVFVKIDVEGLELEVLSEVSCSLKRFSNVKYIIEVNNKNSLEAVVNLLAEHTAYVFNYSARKNSISKLMSLIMGRKVTMSKYTGEKIQFPCQLFCSTEQIND